MVCHQCEIEHAFSIHLGKEMVWSKIRKKDHFYMSEFLHDYLNIERSQKFSGIVCIENFSFLCEFLDELLERKIVKRSFHIVHS